MSVDDSVCVCVGVCVRLFVSLLLSSGLLSGPLLVTVIYVLRLYPFKNLES